MTRRQEHTRLGKETVKRIAKALSIYGTCEITNGTYGNPDIIMRHKGVTYAIEVKRCKVTNFNKGVNKVNMDYVQYDNLIAYGNRTNAKPILAVELVIKNRDNIIFILDTDSLVYQALQSRYEISFGFTIWQIIAKGVKPICYFR